MRGKDTDEITDVLRSRITPAYAGKSYVYDISAQRL